MGLKDYREYKKMEEFKALLSNLGISLDDIKEIASLKTEIKDLKERVNMLETNQHTKIKEEKEMSEDEKKFQAALDGKTMPADFIKMFTGDLEELKPNGRSRN